ncbi:hypothetical protein [Limosilactobacillus fermentum]|uniref:hypothetical protein n=1 Tax=Limosilactobacillus fermentum TaxID=1613 RepID=UPI00209BD127|nr:hypothetical protein [Limosilactobacillus fermentum]MCO8301181.1 hypothetical protein [Limosilactobacillus fermentum]
MKEIGIKVVVNTTVGVDVTAAELKQHYQRIVLAIGARSARDLDVKGRQLKGIYQAVDFLTLATKKVVQGRYQGDEGSGRQEGPRYWWWGHW